MEDTTDLILNLKRVPLKMHVEHPKTLLLKTSEAGEVRAEHITPDPDIEILDPEAYVATLGQGSTLSVEMRVKQGRGYVSADKNFDEDLSIGWIPVDSVHSPIKKVNYFVENARVGQATDYEKLTLEVWTNGAVSPRDAVGLASKLMKDHLTIFINIEDEDEAEGTPVEISEQDRELWWEKLNKSVDEMELSVRSYNCLKNANIRTIGELVQKTESRDAQDQELRPQVAQRDQGDPGRHGPLAGHEARQLPGSRRAAGLSRMRHRVAHRKLGRTTPHRIALLRNLATALFERERIRTTLMKAKELRPYAEKLITLAKRDDDRLHARRLVLRDIHDAGGAEEALRHAWARASPRGPAATRASCASARAGATARRWRSSSCSAPSTSPRRRARRARRRKPTPGQGEGRSPKPRAARPPSAEGTPRRSRQPDGQGASGKPPQRPSPAPSGRVRRSRRAYGSSVHRTRGRVAR